MIDDLLTPEESLRFELGVGHMQKNNSYSIENRDQFASQLGIRYGVTANTELYGKLTGRVLHFRQREKVDPKKEPKSGW